MRRTEWCQPDFCEVVPQLQQCLISSLTYKGTMLDKTFEQILFDLFIFYKSRLGIVAKESILDWAAYKEVKLVT